MNTEIERKFLVKTDAFKAESYQEKIIKQGYLNSNKNRTVRIRVADNKGFITVKGKSNTSGISRLEWEKEIAVSDANALLLLCEPSILDKKRYLVKAGSFIFEVDEFFGENQGLVVAEIELNNENETFTKPHWLGIEVTGEVKYYNAYLSKHPYKEW